MALLAMAVPISPGKTEQFKKFVAELNGPRRAEFLASRKRLGVHERTFLQHTPHGDLVVVTIEGANPAKAFQDFGQSADPFAKWFFQQVQELHGMDMRTPPGPFPEMVIDTSA
jgi:hypothetical protein